MRAGYFDPKTPYERIQYSMDFANLLGVATIVSQVVSIAGVSGTLDVSTMLDGSATASGSIVKQWIRNGAAGQTYKVSFQIVDSAGALRESDGILSVVAMILGDAL